MNQRIVVLSAAICMLSSAPAGAYEVAWTSGSHNLIAAEARLCTLVVVPQHLVEALPSLWRLAYVTEEGGNEPLHFLEDSPPVGVAGLCRLTAAASPASMIAHLDTLHECSTDPTLRAPAARYLLVVGAGTKAKIRFLPLGDSLTASAATALLDPRTEVTINGGPALPYPPLPIHAGLTRAGEEVSFRVSGLWLEDVRSMTYVESGSGARTRLNPVLATGSQLEAAAHMTTLVVGGHLEVENSMGQAGAIPIARETAAQGMPWAPDHVLVRFRRGQVDLPPGPLRSSVASASYAAPALRDSLLAVGVTSLERALPSFRHEDAHSVNLAGEPVELEDLADLFVARLTPASSPQEASRRLSNVSGVLYASLDVEMRACVVPNDPHYGRQWGLHGIPPDSLCGLMQIPFTHILAENAWDASTGSPSVRVAILDSGIEFEHPDLHPRPEFGPNYWGDSLSFSTDVDGHGTAVAGIALASGNNGIGVAGVAWNSIPVSVKWLQVNPLDPSKGAVGYSLGLMKAIEWTRSQGIPIINISASTPPYVLLSTDSVRAVGDVCKDSFLSGQTLIVASGNINQVDGDPTQDVTWPVYPAAFHQQTFAVGAMLPDRNRWRDHSIRPGYCEMRDSAQYCESSNYGPWLDVVAPGGRFIATTNIEKGYFDLQGCTTSSFATMGFGGTSAAAPFASGLAALLKSKRTQLTGEDLEQIMRLTARRQGFDPYDAQVGYGLIDAQGALNFVGPSKTLAHWEIGDGPLSIGPIGVHDFAKVQVDFAGVSGLPSQKYWCYRYRMDGFGSFPFGFVSAPYVWVRASGTLGWRDTINYNNAFEVPWAKIDSVGSGQQFWVGTTYVYRVLDPSDTTHTIGWFPTEPSKARIALTVVGVASPTADASSAAVGKSLAIHVLANPVTTRLKFELNVPQRGEVRVSVLDVQGRRIGVVTDGVLDAGSHLLEWDGRTTQGTWCPAGVFFCRVEHGGTSLARRFVMLGAPR